VNEQQLREQIAREIESKCDCPEMKALDILCDFNVAADIARGKNEYN
jgi:hypothetical protein